MPEDAPNISAAWSYTEIAKFIWLILSDILRGEGRWSKSPKHPCNVRHRSLLYCCYFKLQHIYRKSTTNLLGTDNCPMSFTYSFQYSSVQCTHLSERGTRNFQRTLQILMKTKDSRKRGKNLKMKISNVTGGH